MNRYFFKYFHNYFLVNITAPIDLIGSIGHLLNPWNPTARPMLGTLDKIFTYIYSGNLPFLDPTWAFKIPCADIDLGKQYEKFELGKHGRYGHPGSPFTLLALMTPVLPGEFYIRRDRCALSPPPEPCNPAEDG